MNWYQRGIELPAYQRGFHLVTREILDELPELANVDVGLLNLFLQHTSASLTINENASPEVAKDLESSLSGIVREALPYLHFLEGPDDMPAHVKSSVLGAALTIPITRGRLALGTWQGIFLCEHRNHGTPRRVLATIMS